jgi:hypothetical protein
MLSRRKFLKLFGFASLAISFLPTVFVGNSFSRPLEEARGKSNLKNWLYGSPRRGCSTPDLAFENQSKRAEGLREFVEWSK